MKKRVFAVSVILIIVSLIVSGTIAYYTKEITTTNVVTAGNVKVRLELTQAAGDGEEAAPAELKVIPGTWYSRIVKVKNLGYAPAWVRVKTDVIFTLDAAGQPDPALLSLTGLDTTHWTQSGDYWYYGAILAPGQTTPPLFTGVSFDPHMDNLYQGSRVDLALSLEAVQSEHNGESALEAAGWPQS